MIEILRYLTPSGEDVIGDWLASLRDARTRAKIEARFARVALGNFGDSKGVQGGVFELRIDWGPGFRVYYAMPNHSSVLLLNAGDKSTQSANIKRALSYWSDYKRRTKHEKKKNQHLP
jgi:putative addiction module killer protein